MSDDSNQTCAICLSAVDSDESTANINLRCNHKYHQICTRQFNKRECPQCATPLSIIDNHILQNHLQHLDNPILVDYLNAANLNDPILVQYYTYTQIPTDPPREINIEVVNNTENPLCTRSNIRIIILSAVLVVLFICASFYIDGVIN